MKGRKRRKKRQNPNKMHFNKEILRRRKRN
jgi:hypothetical protein